MKKNLLVVLFLILKNLFYSQTLTAVNCNPVIGDVVDRYADNYVSPGNGGTGHPIRTTVHIEH